MMDWKTKVLFVLVLFGSVVPVSAQEAQEAQEGSVIPAVLSVLAVTLTLLVKSWWRMEDKVTATNKKDRRRPERSQGRRTGSACRDRNEHPHGTYRTRNEHPHGAHRTRRKHPRV